ncbi:MAG: hypothetical protein LC775_10450 [Acidobacteria bacterium]|nr:hypothetical protein [Acidobacteriota bacterium]
MPRAITADKVHYQYFTGIFMALRAVIAGFACKRIAAAAAVVAIAAAAASAAGD